MSAQLIGCLGLIVLFILMFSGMWIGPTFALIGFVGYALIMGLDPAFAMVSQIPFTTVAWYPMSCIPMFILMGILIFQSGIGEDLYRTAYIWLGSFRGGIAMATTVACAFFAAITGVSSPALATLGKVAIPEMQKFGYNLKLATGSLCCAGTMAFLIPPSMSFIIYGILTETSIVKLFAAGFIPGCLLAAMFLVTIFIITRVRPNWAPAAPTMTWKQKFVSLKLTWPVIFLFILVLGGIYLGIFTPTEAAAIGTFGALMIGLIMRRYNRKNLSAAFLEAGQTAAMILLLIVGAYILMKFLAVSHLTLELGQWIAGLPLPSWGIFIAIVIMYIVFGMFLDIMSAVILTIPVIFPVALAMGWDPVWFGVIVTILVEMGVVTPPVGMDAFVLSGITKIPLATIFQGVFPFLIPMVLIIVLIAFFPQLVLWLPGTMSGG
jgi:C4-dicarboxylate transporter, DctM subunit